jgi:hypothetical protein
MITATDIRDYTGQGIDLAGIHPTTTARSAA